MSCLVPRSVIIIYGKMADNPPFLKLTCSVQKYAWGKLGNSSEVAKLASSGNPHFSVDESIPYAEVSCHLPVQNKCDNLVVHAFTFSFCVVSAFQGRMQEFWKCVCVGGGGGGGGGDAT